MKNALSAQTEMDVQKKSENFQNWIPVRIHRKEQKTLVDWCDMGNKRFTEPFFEETIAVRKRDSLVRAAIRQTPLNRLEKLSGRFPAVEPTGFIFHLSRCGSTLISQMFAALDKNIVISEAPPIDSIIRCHYQEPEISRAERLSYLKFLVSALGQKRFAEEKHLFIKFDCWHTLNLDLVTEAFPDVPWIFLYRNPVEVIVSHLRLRGMQMMPGVIENMLSDFDLQDILQMPIEEYCARVLGRICQSALTSVETPNALLINYSQLPEAAISEIPEHFKVSYDFEDVEKMRDAAKFNAKMPQISFTSDVKSKNEEAGIAVRRAVGEYVESYYGKLEAIRLKP